MKRNVFLSGVILMSFTFSCYTNAPVFASSISEDRLLKLEEMLDSEEDFNGSIVGISIRDGISGEILFDYNGDLRLRPASNMKLFTTAVAFEILGPMYSFNTEVHTDGKIIWNFLNGNLYLKGKGDVTITKEVIDSMVEELKNQGIKIIRGDIIGDDSWYDDVRYSIDVPWSDEEKYYGAQISALTASHNKNMESGTVVVKVSPNAIGERGEVFISPPTNYITITNETITVRQPNKSEIKVMREHGTNNVVIEGKIGIESSGEEITIPVWEPTDFTLELFKQSLKAHDISILGDVRSGETPSESTILTACTSVPLSKLVFPLMKYSINSHAEVLIKEMGRKVKGDGSWEKGLEVVEEELVDFGVDTNTLVLRDGSGISHVNLIPTNEVTQLLYGVQSKDWFSDYLAALPEAGNKNQKIGGTLKNRMDSCCTHSKVMAKTGTLTTVSSLSGYIYMENGQRLIFSIIVNNVLDEKKAKEAEDWIIQVLVNS